jgi:competence protein ComEC
VQAWLLIIGLIAVLLAFVAAPLAQILFWFDLVLLGWTIGVVRSFAALPFADAELYVDPRLIALYYGILIGAAMLNATRPAWALRLGQRIRRRSVASAVVFAGIATVVLSASIVLSRPDGMLHIWLLDIGHSNAILAQSPHGAQILVDGGRFPSQLLTALGDRMPFHDRSIEVIMFTQPDENDTAALSAVLNRYDVGLVLQHGQPNLSSRYAELESLWADIPQAQVQAGYRLETDDGLTLEILHPQTQPRLEDSLDDQALVARLGYGDISFLLSGDLSATGQEALLEAGQWPSATVLQVPQHGGSDTLQQLFLEAVQPQLAILQADRSNRRGDPDPATLALLGDTPLLRSDELGTLHLWTDGHVLWYQSEG